MVISWKNKKKELALKSDEIEEIEETLGAKLKHFNRNKLNQVRYLKRTQENTLNRMLIPDSIPQRALGIQENTL